MGERETSELVVIHTDDESIVSTLYEVGEKSHVFDGSEGGIDELRGAAVDPEDASGEVGVVTVDEVYQWL